MALDTQRSRCSNGPGDTAFVGEDIRTFLHCPEIGLTLFLMPKRNQIFSSPDSFKARLVLQNNAP